MIKKYSQDRIKKMTAWHKESRAKEIYKKISNSHKGMLVWNKGKKGIYSAQTLKRMSEAKMGKKMPASMIKKMRIISSNRRHSIETRRKIGNAHRGCKSIFWKGGIHAKHLIIRNSLEYKLWREAVFKRDNWTCVWCGVHTKKGLGRRVKLNADHIKSFALYPKLRLVVENGRTLCKPCHLKTDTHGVNINKRKICQKI